MAEEKARILIVDDNVYNLEVLCRRLERRGYLVKTAEDGRTALDAIHADDYDLVLLDIMMPGLSGMDVLEEARRTYSKTTLPIIMVTSKGESEDVVDALNQGANDYIMKPIDFPVLLARIQTQISQKQEFSSYSQTKVTWSLSEGDRFGNFRLEKKIGSGGMGAVYKAHNANLDRTVALKVILPGHELSKPQIERFTREARALAKIKHPNIVTVYEIGEEPQYYFTMDFIEGENLSQLIREKPGDPVEMGRLCARIASALVAAHEKGIVHRDLKPSNIMVDASNSPHLMDFGLAKLDNESEQITRTGDLLGTPEYMAPEQVDPAYGEVDALSDIYSLGVILFELVTGKPPFSGTPIRVLWQKLNETPPPPSSLNDKVSPEMDAVCQKAMALKREDRFASAMEMKNALEALPGN
ncbi:MAG: protein kinase [Acidobacteriota bacterium]|nr:protein kinase [Acidobacteriota bacterium]